MKYTTPAAFRAALDQQLKAEAERTGLNITRLRKRVAFELFLRRLVAVGPGRWVLKGAFSRKETTMTVIDRPWLFRDDDERPRFKTSWHGETRPASARWPGPLPKRQFEAHDPTTRKLIEQYQALYRLEHGHVIAPLLDDWKWLDKMASAAEKQKFLEPLLMRIRREPGRNEAILVFILLVARASAEASRASSSPRGPGLGAGKRFFGEGTMPAGLKLVDSEVSKSGVTINTYERAGEITPGLMGFDEPTDAELERRLRLATT